MDNTVGILSFLVDRLKPLKKSGEPRVKVLYVVHYFLPKHQAGTEIYTRTLAKEMARQHDVTILTSEDADLPPG